MVYMKMPQSQNWESECSYSTLRRRASSPRSRFSRTTDAINCHIYSVLWSWSCVRAVRQECSARERVPRNALCHPARLPLRLLPWPRRGGAHGIQNAEQVSARRNLTECVSGREKMMSDWKYAQVANAKGAGHSIIIERGAGVKLFSP